MSSTPRRLARWVGGILALILVLPLLYLGISCLLMLWPARPQPEVAATAEATEAPVEAYVVSNGVHTDLVLPMQAAGVDWRPIFPPAHARHLAGEPEFIAIGWGDLEFYLNTPQWRDLTASRALGAVLGRHPSALHVSWLRRDELPRSRRWKLPLSAAQYQRLARHVKNTLPEGIARPTAGAHYGDNDAFYAATGHYHLLRTCNEWTG